MRLVRTLFLATTILASSATFAQADVEVIASIKPVHSLVAAVMELSLIHISEPTRPY